MKVFASFSSLKENTDVNGTTYEVKLKGATVVGDVEITIKKVEELADLADMLGVRDIKHSVMMVAPIDVKIENKQTELPEVEAEEEEGEKER